MKTNNILILASIAMLSLSGCGNDDEQPAATAMPGGHVAPPGMPAPQATTGAGMQARPGMAGYTGVTVQAPTYTQGDLEYVEAITSGNVRRVKSILEAGTANIHSGDEHGVSGLILASSLKNSDVVEAILDKISKGDIKTLDRTDKNAETPMIHAVQSGTPEIIALLRKKGANPNIYNVQQNFALLLAVKKGDIDSVKALMKDYGDVPAINLDMQSSTGETAALAATRANNRDILKLLKESGANLNSFDVDGITPLIYAVSKSDKEMFDYLLLLGADINYLGIGKKTPLLYAIETKNYEFAKYVIDKGANPNIHVKDLASPLQLAVSGENSNLGIVEYLLAKGAALNDPQIPLGNVIGRSIHKGNAPVIAKLMAAGAKASDLEDKNNNGLLEALNIEDSEIAVMMLDNGADMNKLDVNGNSPLALAAKKKLSSVFLTLAKRGVDINQVSQNPKQTPLEIVMDSDNSEMLEIMFNYGLKTSPDILLLRAVNNKNDNIVPVLLLHKANVNIANTIGEPILWTAIAKDDNIVAKALIDAGANLNVQDPTKNLPPLSLAINKNNVEMAKYLIEKGANPNLADSNGFTSLAYAAANGQAELVKLLMTHGADLKAVDKNNTTISNLVDLSKLPDDKKTEIKTLLATPVSQVQVPAPAPAPVQTTPPAAPAPAATPAVVAPPKAQ